ncbi:peroxidase 17-like [Asparagus officinalis]|uniref:peroxidase 17-like n=1 Tax=Asparagus officinalis TaxID=4686 RepID=UPI00098E7079|nr:peroxidase 17-like [Asparagus officinalis]
MQHTHPSTLFKPQTSYSIALLCSSSHILKLIIIHGSLVFLSHTLLLFFLSVLSHSIITNPQLRVGYYSDKCPRVESIVRELMRRAMARDPRSVASVLRFQFHDCFVNGCDASILLDDTSTMLGEKLALSTINSLKSFDVIDDIKEALEKECPGVVSRADIIIMAARDAVGLSGGPKWEVKLGREDSLTASQADSDNIMPSPRADASTLIPLFRRFNLSVTDLVALSGSHSIGHARCFSIAFRLYNQLDSHMDPSFRAKLDHICPKDCDGNVTAGFDQTPLRFDNRYFKDLVFSRGVLNSDQTMFSGSYRTKKLVRWFSRDEKAFFDAFVEGMVKLGDLSSGRRGEVRRNCRVVSGGSA